MCCWAQRGVDECCKTLAWESTQRLGSCTLGYLSRSPTVLDPPRSLLLAARVFPYGSELTPSTAACALLNDWPSASASAAPTRRWAGPSV